MIETNTIYNESCLATMARLPDDSINTVVCSPPYYGMRSYGTEPQPWGGSSECPHEWGERLRHPNFDSRAPEEKRRQGGTVGNNLKTEEISASSGGQFCTNCSAWLGELGSEPTVLMFIDNLTTIFREVYRVLTPDGTCWVNLDDSYNSGGNIRSGPDQTDSKQNTTVSRSKVGYVKVSTSGQPVRRKSMFNVPHRFAIAMTDEVGFIQRNALIWQKESVSPESVKDRLTHEYEMFHLFVKNPKYFFNQQLEPYRGPTQKRSEKVLEHHELLSVPYNRAGDGNPDGRNMRDVLRINTDPSKVAHYATYPKKLAELPIKAGCPEEICVKCGHARRALFKSESVKTARKKTGVVPNNAEQQSSTGWKPPIITSLGLSDCGCNAGWTPGIVYDPFTGSGTTPLTAYRLNRRFLGSELQEKYHKIATDRLAEEMNKLRLFI